MIDILAIGPHPDDIEMFMAGTMMKLKEQGHKTGVCDLTRGELGTYGDIGTREAELQKATKAMDLDARITLDMPDGNVRNTEENRMKIIDVIRQLRPEVVFSFADLPLRHPDHYHTGRMVRECVYLAGLRKIETRFPAFRPASFVGFPELTFDKPSFVVDITPYWEKRKEAIMCFGTQVIKPGEDDSETKTFIRSNRFWEIQEARAGMAGALIGVKYGEPFFSEHPPRIDDPIKAFSKDLR